MSSIELFNKTVYLRDKDCILYNEEQRNFPNNTANLYIMADLACNANCEFCEYHVKPGINNEYTQRAFNYSKFKEILSELGRKLSIRKLNITGGEPTLNMANFDRIFKLSIDGVKTDKTEVTINTNGIRLMELLNYIRDIDSIGLSRHHYSDSINEQIFRCSGLPTLQDIQNFQSKSPNPYILHSRCNLISGYIDRQREIQIYLDTLADAGIVWAGFVTLMPLNQWCIDNVVLDNSLIEENQEFRRNQLWTRVGSTSTGSEAAGRETAGRETGREAAGSEAVCSCADYLYTTPSGKIITFYNRLFCRTDLSAGQLVFDGQYLRQGFGGTIIY